MFRLLNSRHQSHTWLFVAALLLVSAGLTASADQTTTPESQVAEATNGYMPGTSGNQQASPENSMIGFAGVKIFIDPETGRVRTPTEEEKQSLARALRQRFPVNKSTQSQVQHHSDGSMSMFVGLSQINYSRVEKKTDGSLQVSCEKSHGNASDILPPHHAHQLEEK